jgi:hypothetical protein
LSSHLSTSSASLSEVEAISSRTAFDRASGACSAIVLQSAARSRYQSDLGEGPRCTFWSRDNGSSNLRNSHRSNLFQLRTKKIPANQIQKTAPKLSKARAFKNAPTDAAERHAVASEVDRRHFRTRFWRTFSETSPHLSIHFQAEPPIRERKNKVDPLGNECRLGAATCGLVHFDHNIQRSPAKSPRASRIQPARRPGEPMEEYHGATFSCDEVAESTIEA